MLIYSPLSAYFDAIIPQQPALSNDGKQRQPALGDFTSPKVILQNCAKKCLLSRVTEKCPSCPVLLLL
jgi:hypothetical protein